MQNPCFLTNVQLYLLSFLESEVCGEDIIYKVVKVGSIDQPLSLVARVHSSPAELVVSHLTLHEAPHRAAHHRHWLLAWQDQDLTGLINLHSLPEELACIVKLIKTCTYFVTIAIEPSLHRTVSSQAYASC